MESKKWPKIWYDIKPVKQRYLLSNPNIADKIEDYLKEIGKYDPKRGEKFMGRMCDSSFAIGINKPLLEEEMAELEKITLECGYGRYRVTRIK